MRILINLATPLHETHALAAKSSTNNPSKIRKLFTTSTLKEGVLKSIS